MSKSAIKPAWIDAYVLNSIPMITTAFVSVANLIAVGRSDTADNDDGVEKGQEHRKPALFKLPHRQAHLRRSVQKLDLIETTGALMDPLLTDVEEIMSSGDAKRHQSFPVRSHRHCRMDEPEATACDRLPARRESSLERAAW
jgi:hypothetical protein